MEDLFEQYKTLPIEVQSIINDFNTRTPSYELCKKFVKQLEEVGYTCDYGLDASPYNLTVL